jgi:hypothetical protein
MERNDLLNLLYVERQRLSEQHNQIGWSIWVLIGGIIALSWMLLEHYETAIQSNAFEFCWSQVIALFGDFITIAFALLLIKNFYSDRETDYRSDRFNKSKLPVFIVLDMAIAISIYIYYKIWSNNIIGTILTFTIMYYFGVKCAELYQAIKYKQQMPLLFKQFVYISTSIIVLVVGVYKISTHYNYYITNTKYALISSGILIILYILFWQIWNPVKKSIIAIDKLINNTIINEKVSTELIYNEFIAIKIGYKYSQLYEYSFQKIKDLLVKQDVYIVLLRKNMDDFESSQDMNKEMLNKSIKLFDRFQKENKTSAKLTQKLLSKMERDLDYITFNKENKLEIEKLLEIVKSNFSTLNKNVEIISDLVDRFKEIIDRQKRKYNNCYNYCRFADNRVLCYLHRFMHYLRVLKKC